ncbi:MAG: thioredoxin family protein [Clostridiales bacterium]|nr:thioredoxin family protein [Clostridiales bacterium]
MIIKVLGTGCKNCIKLEENVKEAIKKMNSPATVEKIVELEKILAYDVFMTPGLVIDDKVVSMGKVLSPSQIRKIIEEIK